MGTRAEAPSHSARMKLRCALGCIHTWLHAEAAKRKEGIGRSQQHQSIHPFVCTSVYLYIRLSVYLSVHPSVHPPSHPATDYTQVHNAPHTCRQCQCRCTVPSSAGLGALKVKANKPEHTHARTHACTHSTFLCLYKISTKQVSGLIFLIIAR